MKKLILLILIFVLICFAIPIIFTKQYNSQEVIAEVPEQKQEYDYKQYSTIKLLHQETGKIEEIGLDEYLYGVVSAEMPASFEMEALKAQATVARTYTIYKIVNGSKHEEADICDSASCCQAWISKEKRFESWNENERETNWQKIVSAVEETKGKIITYEGEPINAFFHSNSGGTTETATNVWGGTNYPYLQVVTTSGEDAYTQYSSEVTLTKDELIQKLKEYHSDIQIDFSTEDSIKILENTESGRIKSIKFGNIEISGVEARTIFGLKSAMFSVVIEGNNIIFKVLGYGHGVGMSQTGADSMAKLGNNYEEIIKHYYTGVEIKDV
ncbi:MAG: stage II sporulation protein D [Clostridia bacterium]